LRREQTDGKRDRAKIAGHATLASVGIARENDPAPETRRQVGLLLRILDRDPLPEGVEKNVPDRSQYAEHS
jgi:hypothetical protein